MPTKLWGQWPVRRFELAHPSRLATKVTIALVFVTAVDLTGDRVAQTSCQTISTASPALQGPSRCLPRFADIQNVETISLSASGPMMLGW